jgi:hypothetical protein
MNRLKKTLIRLIALAGLIVFLTACPGSQKETELPLSSFKVDAALTPNRPTIPGIAGGPERPVTTLADKDGFKSDFVENELIVTTKDKAALDALVAKWQGTVLESTVLPKVGNETPETVYLVQLNTANADTNVLADNLKKLEPKVRGDYTFGSDTGLKLFAATTQERLANMVVTPNWLTDSSGIETKSALESPTGALIDGSGNARADASGMMLFDGSYPKNVYDWNYMKSGGNLDTGVTKAWSVLAGSGKLGNKIPIAVFDGGIYRNPDLDGATMYGNWDTPNPASCGRSPCPLHGTGTSITAFGRLDNGYGSAGVAAPIARPIVVQSPNLDVWSIIKYVADAVGALTEGPRIINISAGFVLPAVPAAVVKPAISVITFVFRTAGVLVVVAAGNDGLNLDEEDCFIVCWYKRTSLPCEAGNVLCVGSMNPDQRSRAVFSNYGQNVDIYGPGTVWIPDPRNLVGNTNVLVNGTSESSPFVAGAAGLVMAANPGLSASEVEAILLETAHTQNADSVVRRAINVYAAVNRVLGNKPPIIEIRSNPAQTDLLARTALYSETLDSNYQGFFRVFDPNDDIDSLNVRSDRETGRLGESSANGVTYETFETDGPRTLTITATDKAGATTQAFLTLNVVNSPPEPAQLEQGTLTVGQGDELFMNLPIGQPIDKNTPLTCDNVRWSAGSNSLITDQGSSVGCQAIAVFSEQGTRQVTVTVTDAQGLATERVFDVNVTAPSAVKLPKVGFIEVAGIQRNSIIQDTTILNASVPVTNPDNIAVSYSWSWQNNPLPNGYIGFLAGDVATTPTLTVKAGFSEIDTVIDGKRFLCRAVATNGQSFYTSARLIVEVSFAGTSKIQRRDFPFTCIPLQPR